MVFASRVGSIQQNADLHSGSRSIDNCLYMDFSSPTMLKKYFLLSCSRLTRGLSRCRWWIRHRRLAIGSLLGILALAVASHWVTHRWLSIRHGWRTALGRLRTLLRIPRIAIMVVRRLLLLLLLNVWWISEGCWCLRPVVRRTCGH